MMNITNEMLDKAFGDMRVNGEGELYSWSVEALSKRDIYGKDIKYVIIYDGCSDPQKYVDNWMNSTLANNYADEYFKGDDNMNKYETLLKKYKALYNEFEDYKLVSEGLATEGVYIKNEALAELLEIKDKFNSLYKEHTVYCSAAEDVTVKLIEIEKKYDELKNERDGLVKEVYYLHEVINEKNSKCKEKMDKIKQRDKQITEYIRKNNELKESRDYLVRKINEECDGKEKKIVDLIKERDELKQRLEHINAMSNLEWKFEVVEETETAVSSYDELVDFCETRHDSCVGCPKEKPCNAINHGLRPAKWNEDEIAEYNETMALTKPATPYDELVSFCETRREGGKDCFGCPNEIACDGINPNFRPAKWTENQKEDYNELIAMVNNKEGK